jgi:hypothetical protein
MKSSKTLAALVTLGLAAAVATPAMALENQFSGSFTSFYDISNFSAGNGSGTPVKDAKTENYFVQRARLGYTAKASETVKLVTLFQIDYKYWGKDSYSSSFNGGSAIGSRGLNLQTKNVYLDLNLPASTNAKIGMQGVSDAFKGIIISSDAAGILVSHEYGKASVAAGFFRLADSLNYNADYTAAGDYISNATPNKVGRNTQDLFLLDGKYNISKETKVGAAYYFIGDNRQNSAAAPNEMKVSTLGINAESVVGPVTVNGFALTQFGDIDKNIKAKGFAFNFGAKAPLAGGTARTEFIYASGGDNGKSLVIPSSVAGTEGGGFYDNEMVILSRDKNATNFDKAVVFDVNNNGQGVIMGSLGYDYPFSPKLSGSVNLGFGATDKDKNFLGTEINCETNYKLTPEVTFGARAGYLIVGDAFKSTDNPYDVKLIAKFSF